MTDDLATLELDEPGVDWDAVDEIDKRVSRHWPRQWDTITTFLEVLMHQANGCICVRCKDKYQLDVLFDPNGKDIETLSVVVPQAEGASLRKLWPDVKQPAAGKAFDVPVADVVELIWTHGGIDLAASRKATKCGWVAQGWMK